jgi:NAD(P)-dependent dehydrogenase (short-subunit alcohol dehydrogenase family)
MVSDQEIRASNSLINDATIPQVAVFVGGTSGIGKITIQALVSTGASTRIYLVGRKSSAERMHTFIEELHAINSKAEVVWVEAEVSLLAESKRVCEFIKSKESRVDLLFLTAGFAGFGGRQETSEGLEITQSLEYYSRMLFIQHLLPLLRQAEAARVVSVLGGGLEKANALDLDDLDLKEPGKFGPVKGQTQFVCMNTVCMDKFASDNPDITFIHSWPGWVGTGNANRTSGSGSKLWEWFAWYIFGPLISLLGISLETSARRYLFQSTSAYYGGSGTPWKGEPGMNTVGQHKGGLYLVHFRGGCTPNLKVMATLRETSAEKVWSHTQEVFQPYL